jgi:hypothetical protein
MGRPKKYLNPLDAQLAKRAQDRQADLRRRERNRAPNPAPASGLQFSYYQPVPPQTQINVTNPRVGLAVDDDITLPEPPRQPLPSGQDYQFTPFGFHHIDYNSEDPIYLDAPVHPHFATSEPALVPRQPPVHPHFATSEPTPVPRQQAPIHPQFAAGNPTPVPQQDQSGQRQPGQIQPKSQININLEHLYLDDMFPNRDELVDLEQQLQERQALDDELAQIVEEQLRIISPDQGQEETQGQKTPQPPRRQQDNNIFALRCREANLCKLACSPCPIIWSRPQA